MKKRRLITHQMITPLMQTQQQAASVGEGVSDETQVKACECGETMPH